jgi:hypothetical protein
MDYLPDLVQRPSAGGLGGGLHGAVLPGRSDCSGRWAPPVRGVPQERRPSVPRRLAAEWRACAWPGRPRRCPSRRTLGRQVQTPAFAPGSVIAGWGHAGFGRGALGGARRPDTPLVTVRVRDHAVSPAGRGPGCHSPDDACSTGGRLRPAVASHRIIAEQALWHYGGNIAKVLKLKQFIVFLS